ncbi:MAG: RDD family protein [Clostridiaceae bacterium]
MINVERVSENMQIIKGKRLLGLVIDQAVWYLLYLVCLLITYLAFNGSPKVTGDAMYYKLQLDEVITSKIFISFYLAVLMIYEVIMPMLSGGKSLSKKILKLHISCKSKKPSKLMLRGIVKLIILNPYGIIGYLIYSTTNLLNASVFSNVLIFIFSISILTVAVSKKGIGLHDLISNTVVCPDK